MKVNFSIEEHGVTHSIVGELNGGDDWITYPEVAEHMSNLLSSVYGYKIYLEADTDTSKDIKAGLNDDDQDVDFK